MSIEFYGVGGVGQIGAMKKADKTQAGKKPGEIQGQDKVQFSSVLQDVQMAQTNNNTVQASRNERIQQIKAQIAEGSYQPDLNKVAASLVQFLVDGK